jgi:hypothetical protein
VVQKLTESRFGIPKFGIPIEIRCLNGGKLRLPSNGWQAGSARKVGSQSGRKQSGPRGSALSVGR